jgi:hypothetical protein
MPSSPPFDHFSEAPPDSRSAAAVEAFMFLEHEKKTFFS